VDVRLAGKEYEVPWELTVALGEAAQAKAANSSTWTRPVSRTS